MKKRFFYVAILSLLSLVSFGQGGYTPIPKLKITTTPDTNNSTTEVLVRDATTGNVGKVAKSSLAGTLDSVTDAGANTTNAISTGGVGINTTTPQALFDVVSTSSGILIPRLTTTQRDAIVSPSTSELIYNSTNGRFEFYNGSAWTFIGVGTPNLTQVLTSGNEVEDIPIRLVFDDYVAEHSYDYSQYIKEELSGQKNSDLNYQRLSFVNIETTESASYDVGKITHNEIDYLLPSGDTSTIATLKDLSDGYIPLSGTVTGSPLAGNIEINGDNEDYKIFKENVGEDIRTQIDFSDNSLRLSSSNIADTNINSLTFASNGLTIISNGLQVGLDEYGVSPVTDLSDNLLELSYVQKIYVDAKIISSNETAKNDRNYSVVANATFTDPTPAEGKGYIVTVINGTATIGGVGYTVGQKVFRHYHSGSWRSFVYNDDLENGCIPLSGTTEGNEVTGNVEFRPEILDFKNPAITTNKTYGSYIEIGVQDDEVPYLDIVDTTVGTTEGRLNLSTSGLTYSIDSTTLNSINATLEDGIEIITSLGNGLYSQTDYSEIEPTNKLIYAQRQYVDNQFGRLISLTETEILAIASPETGRLYYNTTQNHVVFYDGSGWKKLTHSNM